ncbi:MAG: DUF4173 domain-containing protein [Myxococcaceae bacterium]|nr:DUF4173 domain-containing protein [Myxococcaceae bacterium]
MSIFAPPLTIPPTAVSPPRAARATLAAGALLGVLAELLLDGHPLGVALPLYTLALVAALAAVGGRESFQRGRQGMWLLVPLLFFSGMAAVHTDPLLTLLNLVTTGGLLLLMAQAFGGTRLGTLRLGGYVRTAGEALHGCLERPLALVPSAVDVGASRVWAKRHVGPLLRGALLAAPVVALFALLLAQADRFFSDTLHSLLSWNFSRMGDGLRALVVSTVTGLLAAGWLAQALRRATSPVGTPAAEERSRPVGLVEGVVVLVSVCTLFSAFLAVQVRGLLRVLAGERAGDFTYAAYARQGFFELLAVALLSLLLVMALHRWVRREGAREERIFRVMCTVLLVLVLVLLGSALRRLSLYEEMYGATRLRLFSHLFMYALGVVLLWRAVTLWWGGEARFAAGVVAAGLGYLTALNVVVPDALIARRNLARYAATGVVDLGYLASLSDDVLPPVAGALPALDAQGQDTRGLRALLRERKPEPGWGLDFHLGRWRAARAAENR